MTLSIDRKAVADERLKIITIYIYMVNTQNIFIRYYLEYENPWWQRSPYIVGIVVDQLLLC